MACRSLHDHGHEHSARASNILSSVLTGSLLKRSRLPQFVRACAQECFYQRREARLLRFFPRIHLQSLIHLWQQLAAFLVGQKSVVTHHLKMLHRDMADIAPEHLFLRQRLLPVLLRTVVVIVMHHGTAAVVPQLRR